MSSSSEIMALLQKLLTLADKLENVPNNEMYDILSKSLQYGGRDVSYTFFETPTKIAQWGLVDHTVNRDNLAVLVMSFHLSKVEAHNFGDCIDGNLAKKEIETQLKSQEGIIMGRDILLEALIQQHGFMEFLEQKKDLCTHLENELSKQDYIVGTIVEDALRENHLRNEFKVLFLYFLGSTKIKNIMDTWCKYGVSSETTQVYLNFTYTKNHIDFASLLLEESSDFQSSVLQSCNRSQTSSQDSKTTITYGIEVQKWLNSTFGPNNFNLGTGLQPKNIVTQDDPSGGCFLGDTTVLLENESLISIKNVAEGHKVVGARCIIGTVSSEQVQLSLPHDATVLGFNDEEPFFTTGHPFMTQHGWRALNPNAAKAENSWLTVGQLREGDYVKKVKLYQPGRTKDIEYNWVKIERIHAKVCKPGTIVYGLHFREGPRSYHANGYLVHLNYPEITAERIQRGIMALPLPERKHLATTLKSINPIVEKILGQSTARLIADCFSREVYEDQNMAGNYSSKKFLMKAEAKVTGVPLVETMIFNMEVRLSSRISKPDWLNIPFKLSIVRGFLFIGNKMIKDSRIVDDDKIAWRRKIKEGKWEHGLIRFFPSRLYAHGFLCVTNSPEWNSKAARFPVKAKVMQNTYHCFKDGKPFGELIVGVDDNHNIIGKILIPPHMKEPGDLGHSVLFSTNHGKLTVNIDIPYSLQEAIGFVKLSGTFSWDYSSFTGIAIPYDSNKPDHHGNQSIWSGRVVQDHDNVTKLTQTRAEATMQNGSSESHLPKSSPNLTSLLMMVKDSPDDLSLEDLFTLDPPDPKTMHETTIDMLIQATKNKMDDQLRSNLLGVVKPTLNPELQHVADKHTEFLRDGFGLAYLLQGLSQSEALKKFFTEDMRNKLLYYWNANAKGCLGSSKDYSSVNDDISRIAFISLVPRVQNYKADGGEKWAKMLYEKLITPDVMTGIVVQAETAQNRAIINKQTMVLYCLCPEKDYYRKFQRKIMLQKLQRIMQYFNVSKNGKDDILSFMKDAIRQLINMILNDSDKISAEIRKELQKQLVDAMKELGVSSEEEIVTEFESFAADVINGMVGLKKDFWNTMCPAVKQWIDEHPKLKATAKFFGRAFSVLSFGLTISVTVESFMMWKNLTTEQKVSLVIDTVVISIKTIQTVVGFFAKIDAAFRTGILDWKFLFKLTQMPYEEVVETGIVKMIEETFGGEELIEASIGEALAKNIEDVEARANAFEKFFDVTNKVIKALDMVALAACGVVIGFQIARDFEDGAPVYQKTLDIIQGVCIGIQIVTESIGLVVESAVVAAVGMVCVVVGIVAVIIEIIIGIFEKPKPKPTPAQVFVQGKGKDFISKLPTPSKEWLDEYNKRKKKTHNGDATSSE